MRSYVEDLCDIKLTRIATDEMAQDHTKDLAKDVPLSPSSIGGDDVEKTARFVVYQTSSNDRNSEQLPHHQHAWRPSIYRVGPLAGLNALTFAFLQIFASYAVLKASDVAPLTAWKWQPTVNLAILVAISNKAVAFAVVQGTVITFWLRALNGRTIGQMHRDWAYGLHTLKALTAGTNFTVLALACICITLVAVDGPLLQRASSVRQSTLKQEYMTLNVSILPELHWYSTGWVDFYEMPLGESIVYSPAFIPVLTAYQLGKPISASSFKGCIGVCEAKVLGPALAVDYCTSSLEFRNYSVPLNASEAALFEKDCTRVTQSEKDVFRTNFNVWNGTMETLNFTTIVSDDQVAETCSGHVNITTCIYFSAITAYLIHVDTFENTIIFPESSSNPKILAKANNTALTTKSVKEYSLKDDRGIREQRKKSTLGGVLWIAGTNFEWDEQLVALPGIPIPVASPLPPPAIMPYMTNFFAQVHGACAPAWADPRQIVMAQLNELMFRTGVDYAQNPDMQDPRYLDEHMDPGYKIDYNVLGRRIDKVTVYSSDFSYFAGAATIDIFTILFIVYTFYGWWRLGRNPSLSPLEMAKAFDEPLLKDIPFNLSGGKIAELETSRNIQYGTEREKLIVAARGVVRRPVGDRLGARQTLQLLKRKLQGWTWRSKST